MYMLQRCNGSVMGSDPWWEALASYIVGFLDWRCIFRYEVLNLCIIEWG